MEILDYQYEGPGWSFDRVRFQKINLIVGDSGTGKTRLLNTIFNLGTFVAQGKAGGEGQWDLSLRIADDTYRWKVSKSKIGDHIVINQEQLFLNEECIVDRDRDKFLFQEQLLPKLSSSEMAPYILREEGSIKPLYLGFSYVMRRRFFSDDLEKNCGIVVISHKALDQIGRTNDLHELFKRDLALNLRLFVLQKYFPAAYMEIVDYFKETFDFIDKVALLDSSEFEGVEVPSAAPIFCIKERMVGEWIRLDQLSSGMQKVLLILTDLVSLPSGGIYLIDEYENSLGVGAIDFLPNLLSSRDVNFQLFITSHHPYIINRVPIEYWYVAHRAGSAVQFAYGEVLANRYNLSSQDKYIQLLNDPFYYGG